jgi:hypothetical protein
VSFDVETLYRHLPAVYRVRDAELADGQNGGPLKQLLAVIAEQIAVMEENVEQLYDDQFIETCAEWVVPYIGDLIGYRALYGEALATGSSRAEVGHTIALRRRKGTAAVLEQLARDVTGWNARAVEFFQLLGTTCGGSPAGAAATTSRTSACSCGRSRRRRPRGRRPAASTRAAGG